MARAASTHSATLLKASASPFPITPVVKKKVQGSPCFSRRGRTTEKHSA
jgi:hypothetical protein